MGAIRKRGKSYQIDYVDPLGKRVRLTFNKRKDAEAELGKRVSLMAENRYLDVKKDYKNTFKDLIKLYDENFSQQRSYDGWKKCCIERFKAHFGEATLLSSIKYVDLETYRNNLRQKKTKRDGLRKDASVNREMSCLHHLMSKAVEWDMMERNPFERGKTLLLKENNKRLRFLSEDEIKTLIIECPKHLRRVVVCALNTGMRRGEILSLRWSQVRNGFIYLEKTKTNESRQIPINDTLGEAFKEIRREQGPGREHVFTYAPGEHNLKGKAPVRERKKLAPVPENVLGVKHAFVSSVKRAGIQDFKFHDLRHTFASQMIMKGASLKEVQEILGHKTMTMTLRYAHLSQEHKKKAVNLLNGLTALNAPAEPACHKMSQIDDQSVPAIR